MAKIIPFRGTRYNIGLFDDLSSLFAPPYDIVTKEERDSYVRQNPYNIFRLELPSKADCNGGAADKYRCAATFLHKWQRERIFLTDHEPAIYPYDIEFVSDGKAFVRKGFICLVRTDDWSDGTILPHEKTFQKVTQDRLSLRMTTRAQFSQIFMLYRHQEGLDQALGHGSREELFTVEDAKGCIHKLYRVSDRNSLEQISGCLSGTPLYIADGHHRYTTAIQYRKEMTARYGDNPEALYNYTMVYLVDVKDPGMIVLPTHRLVSIPEGMNCEEVIERLSRLFYLKELEQSTQFSGPWQAHEFKKTLSETCLNGITLLFGSRKRAFVLCPKDEARKELLETVGHRELAELDVVVLEELVFKKALGIESERLEAGRDIIFTADSEGAIRSLKQHQMLFFMHPTPVEQVLDVADAGLSMPHKSTYFYPKILTGMVLNLEEKEGMSPSF